MSEHIARTATEVVVNGFAVEAEVDRHLVDEVLVPTFAGLARSNRSGADASTPDSVRGGRPTPDQGADGRRRFVFLAAPPGTGKSTLAAVIAQRAPDLGLDTIGIDGFHRPQAYLEAHDLAAVKGAPETFDVDLLGEYLSRATTEALWWPTYDRVRHDVVPDATLVDADLVLLEGNWLLLDEPGWRELSTHSTYNVFIDADPALLRERLIRRKVRGGLDLPAATRFYDRSDGPNIDRVLQGTDRSKVDLLLRLNADGTIEREEP